MVNEANLVEYPITGAADKSHAQSLEAKDQPMVENPEPQKSDKLFKHDDKLVQTQSEEQLESLMWQTKKRQGRTGGVLIDNILWHKVNQSKLYALGKLGGLFYFFRLHGYIPSDNHWEPIVNFTRNHVVSYQDRKHISITGNFDAKIVDRDNDEDKTPSETAKTHVIYNIVDHDRKRD